MDCFRSVAVDNPQTPIFCLAVMSTISRRNEEKESKSGTVVSRKLCEYWILALKKSPVQSGVYVRVGVDKTYGREWLAGCCYA
jgi:hypothetical protein